MNIVKRHDVHICLAATCTATNMRYIIVSKIMTKHEEVAPLLVKFGKGDLAAQTVVIMHRDKSSLYLFF